MLRAARIAVVVLAGGARAASGQSSATLDAGGSHVSYQGAPDASVVALTPAFRLEGAARSLNAYASLSRFDGGTWSIQGGADGSVFTREIAYVRAELGAEGDASGYGGEGATGNLAGSLRLHVLGSTSGVWAGGEAGRAWDGSGGVAVRSLEVGGWLTRNPATIVASATPTAVGDALRYTDLQTVGRIQRGPLDLGAFAGLRLWNRPAGAGSDAWGGVNLLLWVGANTALSAGVGSYAADYAQGFPAGRYVTASVRIATRRPTVRQALSDLRPRLVPPLAHPVVDELLIRRGAGGKVRITVRADHATRVDLMGDFTDWEPIQMQRGKAGTWETTLVVEPGVYRMNARVDGGPWGVPSGVPALRDEFGGVVGVMTVR